jgi:hypothetical protein
MTSQSTDLAGYSASNFADSAIDTPARVEHEHHDLSEEQPRVYVTRAGFWRTLVQYVRRQRVQTSSQTRSSSRLSLHQIALPMANMAQEHPMLYLVGFFGMHNG